MSTTCLLATLVVFILFPIVLLLWATESPRQRVGRLRSQGMTQQAIADHLKVTRHYVRKHLTDKQH